MTVIATWNVNSVRARLPRVLEWLDEFEPDVALLQELKATDETFPRLEIEDRGYNVEIHGQKNFNGVGI
ncbi:MAG TPA: exodeoxyribonuclease III, partial [Rhodospirillaceae bacterium]|nr:exodeoxyribonuclease III [Rhodospirillaceae bacterium]